jgi:endonuclease YncB( thermonuclease family)
MPKREVEQHRSPRDVPTVGRPRGAVWRALQADGVVWEGQVYLVGDDVDLASRMIVTHRRVVFVRGGELALDIPREWLRPEPVLRRDGILDLFVAMPGSNLFDEPMTVPLRMREGHPAAGHIIAMLAPGGVRRILPETLSGMERAREAAPVPQFNGFWDDDGLDASWDEDGLDSARAEITDRERSGTGDSDVTEWLPVEPPDRVVRSSSAPARRPQTNGYAITGLQPRDQRKSPWGLFLRVFGLVVLLATAAALGAGRLNLGIPGGGGGSEAILAGPSPTAAVVASPPAAPEAALLPEEEAAIAIGVGGSAAQATAASSSPASAAMQTATETPPPAASPPPPAVIPTPAPTAAATPAPESASGAATEESPEAEADVETPPQSTPAATGVEQPPALDPGAAPAQELVAGPLRITVSSAQRAESLPRYGLPPGSGEWVLLVVEVRNEGTDPASLAMSDFRLYDRAPGTTIELDAGTDVIAGLAGFEPPRSATDDIAVAPGESAEALLLYLLPPGSSDDVAVLAGDTAMDLAPILTAGDTTVAAAPELLQATVIEVLDGARVVVDAAGLRETVQYLGMQAPLADACFAAEAAAANQQLVDGNSVWLERQASDRAADDALLRDVWIADPSGERVLVSARLLEAGAGLAAPAAPDTRYQAWLQSSSALARTNGAGLWGACPDAANV